MSTDEMSKSDGADDPKTDAASPAKPKPEEMGRAVPGTGEALEPEATHNVTGGAAKAGDRMWGPPGTPEKT